MTPIEITFNGEVRVTNSATVMDLLSEFNLASRKVAVELNHEIVPRTTYETVQLNAGDQVEIVQFVGGG